MLKTKVESKYQIVADFMKPEIYQGNAYEVDTNHGISIVPDDVVGDLKMKIGDYIEEEDARFAYAVKELKDFIESGEVNSIEFKKGWLGRMSAPGYMDSTEWSLYNSKEEAEEDLEKMYGDN